MCLVCCLLTSLAQDLDVLGVGKAGHRKKLLLAAQTLTAVRAPGNPPKRAVSYQRRQFSQTA